MCYNITSYIFHYSIFHGVGSFHFKSKTQSFKLHRCLKSSSIKCFITIHRQDLQTDVLCSMLHQRQQLKNHLEQFIDDAHQSHISCARRPVGYLECPFHAHEYNCSPHIRLDQLTQSGEVTCPRSIDYKVVPREAYALLFVPSLRSSKFTNNHFYSLMLKFTHFSRTIKGLRMQR